MAAAAANVALLLLFASHYGYHRDELYFLSSAKRLAWGFVDQPPVTPAIARVSEAIAPGSLIVLRLWPALFSAASIVLATLCARELGAGRLGQTAIAVAVATSPGILAAGHLLSTATLDITLWVGTTFLVLRLLRTGETRLWLGIGALLGIGLLNKWTIGFLAFGLLVGMLLGPERRLIASPWFAAGVLLALALWAPNLWWQADHGWPQIDMFRHIQEGASDIGATIVWVPLQIVISGFLLTPLWLAGLVRLFGSSEARRFRALGIAYGMLALALALAAGDKPYYVAALYLPLAGAGAVRFERWWARAPWRGWRAAAPAILASLTVLSVPLVLPVLPAETLAQVPLQDINYDLGEQIGWPTFAAQIERAWGTIPAEERGNAIILTGNYGEAGAIERFAPDLPTPYSGHNTWWWWGTPPEGTMTALVVGISEQDLSGFFGQVEQVGRLDNGMDVETEEQGASLWIARAPRTPLPEIWLAFRHYN